MSFNDIAKAIEAACQSARPGGNIYVVIENVNLTIGDGAPVPVSLKPVEPGGYPEFDAADDANPEAGEPFDNETLRKLADVTKEARALDEDPDASERLLTAAYFGRSLKRERLLNFAPLAGFTKETADRLWNSLHGQEFIDFAADRGIPMAANKRGDFPMTNIRAVAGLEDLKPGCVPFFGPKQCDLLRAIAKH